MKFTVSSHSTSLILVKGNCYTIKNIHWFQIVTNLIHCSTKSPSSKKRSRETIMYGIGSTITATQWPRFYHGNKCHTLPRPYKSCKSYEPGWILMRKSWFIDLVNLMERQVLIFFEISTKTPYVS